MFEPKTFIEMLMFATIRIKGTTVDRTHYSGTGFLYLVSLPDNLSCPILLTNKHVLRDSEGNSLTNIALRFHLSNVHSNENKPCGEYFDYDIPLNSIGHLIIPHPMPEVDLIAIMINPIIQQISDTLSPKNLKPFFKTFSENLIWDDATLLEKLDAAREVLMVGYPIGMSDEIHNLPIIRKGIVASIPHLDFNGKPEGLVDMACFPGSSGSPIVLYEAGMYQEKFGGTVVGSRFAFLGVLWGGPTNEAALNVRPIPTIIEESMQISDTTTSQKTSSSPTLTNNPFFTKQLVHLGFYVKAKEILTIANIIKQICTSSYVKPNITKNPLKNSS
jgi:hypothetical protein